MNLAKKAFLLVLGLALIAPMLGCGVGTTEAESHRMVMRSVDYDSKMLVDDLGLLTLTNRPFRGSRWIVD